MVSWFGTKLEAVLTNYTKELIVCELTLSQISCYEKLLKIHIYTHTYIHTYIHTYKHTYIQTNKRDSMVGDPKNTPSTRGLMFFPHLNKMYNLGWCIVFWCIWNACFPFLFFSSAVISTKLTSPLNYTGRSQHTSLMFSRYKLTVLIPFLLAQKGTNDCYSFFSV